MPFQVEFDFILPKGYVDENGDLHKQGVMRLATAGDEILPLKDPRVQQNPAYLTVILLSRVVLKLGTLPAVNPRIIEALFSSDFSYLQEMYRRINDTGTKSIHAACPKCGLEFEVEVDSLGEE